LRTVDAARQEKRPAAVHPASNRLADEYGGVTGVAKVPELLAIRNRQAGCRPGLRTDNQQAIGRKQSQPIDLRHLARAFLEEVECRSASHAGAQGIRCIQTLRDDPGGYLAKHQLDRLKGARGLLGDHQRQLAKTGARVAVGMLTHIPHRDAGGTDHQHDQCCRRGHGGKRRHLPAPFPGNPDCSFGLRGDGGIVQDLTLNLIVLRRPERIPSPHND
jgi:hypothetical protein